MKNKDKYNDVMLSIFDVFWVITKFTLKVLVPISLALGCYILLVMVDTPEMASELARQPLFDGMNSIQEMCLGIAFIAMVRLCFELSSEKTYSALRKRIAADISDDEKES